MLTCVRLESGSFGRDGFPVDKKSHVKSIVNVPSLVCCFLKKKTFLQIAQCVDESHEEVSSPLCRKRSRRVTETFFQKPDWQSHLYWKGVCALIKHWNINLVSLLPLLHQMMLQPFMGTFTQTYVKNLTCLGIKHLYNIGQLCFSKSLKPVTLCAPYTFCVDAKLLFGSASFDLLHATILPTA